MPVVDDPQLAEAIRVIESAVKKAQIDGGPTLTHAVAFEKIANMSRDLVALRNVYVFNQYLDDVPIPMISKSTGMASTKLGVVFNRMRNPEVDTPFKELLRNVVPGDRRTLPRSSLDSDNVFSIVTRNYPIKKATKRN